MSDEHREDPTRSACARCTISLALFGKASARRRIAGRPKQPLEYAMELDSRPRDGPTMISGEGLALTASWNGLAPLVFASVAWPGPAPRKVQASEPCRQPANW